MTAEQKRNLLLEAGKKIKSFGYKVYILRNNIPDCCWIIFSDGKTVAYLQCGSFGTFSISTIHKPSKLAGIGINVSDEFLLKELTKDMCEEALSLCPNWYKGPGRNDIVKYTPEEYFEDRVRYNTYFDEI